VIQPPGWLFCRALARALDASTPWIPGLRGCPVRRQRRSASL